MSFVLRPPTEMPYPRPMNERIWFGRIVAS
jgi:hypothetical protein